MKCFAYYVASRGKEVSAATPKAKEAAPALDYVDIPHSQIRKVSIGLSSSS